MIGQMTDDTASDSFLVNITIFEIAHLLLLLCLVTVIAWLTDLKIDRCLNWYICTLLDNILLACFSYSNTSLLFLLSPLWQNLSNYSLKARCFGIIHGADLCFKLHFMDNISFHFFLLTSTHLMLCLRLMTIIINYWMLH